MEQSKEERDLGFDKLMSAAEVEVQQSLRTKTTSVA
jgi:hypothetical protein